MKVTLPKDYRKLFTLEEMDIARKIIHDMKKKYTVEKPATRFWKITEVKA